jgi:hypothetical protein
VAHPSDANQSSSDPSLTPSNNGMEKIALASIRQHRQQHRTLQRGLRHLQCCGHKSASFVTAPSHPMWDPASISTGLKPSKLFRRLV